LPGFCACILLSSFLVGPSSNPEAGLPNYLFCLNLPKQKVEFPAEPLLWHQANHVIHPLPSSKEQQGWS
jgi:hypothetical protein